MVSGNTQATYPTYPNVGNGKNFVVHSSKACKKFSINVLQVTQIEVVCYARNGCFALWTNFSQRLFQTEIDNNGRGILRGVHAQSYAGYHETNSACSS